MRGDSSISSPDSPANTQSDGMPDDQGAHHTSADPEADRAAVWEALDPA